MKRVKLVLILSVIILTCLPAYGQIFTAPDYYEHNLFFMTGGAMIGPKFDSFVNWANQFYPDQFGSPERISDFGNTFDFSVGMRTRFAYHFAFEIDFSTSLKKTRKSFDVGGGQVISQELELNTAIVTASVPVIFQFTNRQPIVPFVAAGVSIFPIRLDHYISTLGWRRYTKTALGANFSVGIDSKIRGRFWLTARGDWTYGNTNMEVTQGFPGEPDHFSLDLNTTTIQAGVMYAFQ